MTFSDRFNALDSAITHWMAHYGVPLLRISLGVVFFWFGFLKFFPGMSPAQDLATRTIGIISFGAVQAPYSLWFLAAWESAIGLALIFGILLRTTLLLLFLQMLGTIMPLFFFPSETFVRVPFAPTLEGQYILKNVVLISAAIVIGATVRGGRLVAEPQGSEAGLPNPEPR